MTVVMDGSFAPLIDTLQRRCMLPPQDIAAFLTLPFTIRRVAAGHFIMRDDDQGQVCCGLLSGFAYRHKIVSGGGRQILSVHIPGDIVDLQNVLLPAAHHSTQMLTPGSVAIISARAMQDLAFRCPALGRALWLESLVDGAITREWLANVGRRDARSRISHLLCELSVRLRAIGLCHEGSFELPMTQEQIADATGLTPIHVNRTLQALRSEGLISSNRRIVTIEDWNRLAQLGDFSADYLYVPRSPDQALVMPVALPAASRIATASATLMPSTAAERMPPA